MASARSLIKAAIPKRLHKGLRRRVAALSRWAAPEAVTVLGPDLAFLASAPTEMSIEERLFLYALVRGERF